MPNTTTISTRRGLYLKAKNSNFPKLANIPAIRLLRSDENYRLQNGTKPLPVVGRCPSVQS